ncbi:MAG: phosphatase PAP2 family protein [Bacteroidetes bacterium]|nr:phosphatase PAP2 family protein [Bacteroidota bacterium]MBP7398593.1 phosphatase PAP2 family protein [Chitinophagales bacterium]MBK8487387.1 phosphatase PAP2 family protein [Bacteroidota bacterium]MBK8682871.1 phosphatase PAP2 family protein [Bacteroidota bacterium]MBP8752905.1 phosphatase PAP2 family protein [Chitinophagales bacterium]
MQFPSGIEQFDRNLYLTVNSDWSNSFFDVIMPVIRTKENWIPLYILLAIWLIYKFKWNGFFVILTIAITVTITDQVSSFIMKPLFARPRPCSIPEIAEHANLIIGCSPSYSFTSSHAANHFGLAVVFGLLFLRRSYWFIIVGIFWAASISFAQVYVGVHYPLDVIGGALLGSFLGFLIYIIAMHFIFKKRNWLNKTL